MAKLTAKERAALPDRAFAYIDSKGVRRLPINDASHVRNALARFGQVEFEDDEARERARTRLLRAAQKHGIMPIGFVNGQIRNRRKLPSGDVTFLLADIERSTDLLARLEDAYGPVLEQVRRLVREAVRAAGGHEVDARGDEFFAVFESASSAVEAAVAVQRAMLAATWPDDDGVRVRIGLHRGRPSLTSTGYVGLAVPAARICFSGHGGQIVLSRSVHGAVAEELAEGLTLRDLGSFRFQGLREPVELYCVIAEDLPSEFPALRAATPVAAAGT
jgi:class 3 adenylate cyclase